MRHAVPFLEPWRRRHSRSFVGALWQKRRQFVAPAMSLLIITASPWLGGQQRSESETSASPQICELPKQDQVETDCLVGPEVQYSDGSLLIEPRGATLQTILDRIRERTEITISASGDALQRRVFDRIGPAPLREALVSLLYGTGLNYILQSRSNNPQSVYRIVLSPEAPLSSRTLPGQPSVATSSEPEEHGVYGGVPAASGDSPEPEPQPVVPSKSQANPANIPGIPAGFDLRKAAAEAHKTPGEILGELQRRQIEILDAQTPPQ